MKNIINKFLFFFLCILTITSWGQSKIYNANYIIGDPIGLDDASSEQFDYLNSILQENYTGGKIFSNQSPFVLIPSIRVTSHKNAGEVQGVKVVKLDIGVTSKGKENNLTFHRFKQSYIITANDIYGAIDKALEKFSNEPKLSNFFVQSNQNILTFYQNNCADILQSVKVNIERQEYIRAFDILRFVPEATTCFKEAERIITNIYAQSKEQSCRALVQQALQEEALQNYAQALSYLQWVENNTDCYSSALALIERISTQIDAQTLRDFEMEKLRFSKLTDLQKMEVISQNVDSITLILEQ